MDYISFLKTIIVKLDDEEQKVINKMINAKELNDDELDILNSILEEYKISNCPNCGEIIASDNYEEILFIYEEGMCSYCRNQYNKIMEE